MTVNERMIREVIIIAMRNHPGDCIFAPNAFENIVAATLRVNIQEQLDACVAAFIENEIYCPHEGIDKRHFR